jgi:hypothetical protein
MRIDRRRIDVPTDSEIGRETRRDAVVILRKASEVPCAQMRDIRRVLFKSAIAFPVVVGAEVEKVTSP